MSASEDDYGYADEYVRALDEGRDHACSGVNGHHVVEIIMAIYESVGYGRRVEIPQQNREHPLVRLRREHGLPDTTQSPIQYADLLEAEDRRRASPAQPDTRRSTARLRTPLSTWWREGAGG